MAVGKKPPLHIYKQVLACSPATRHGLLSHRPLSHMVSSHTGAAAVRAALRRRAWRPARRWPGSAPWPHTGAAASASARAHAACRPRSRPGRARRQSAPRPRRRRRPPSAPPPARRAPLRAQRAKTALTSEYEAHRADVLYFHWATAHARKLPSHLVLRLLSSLSGTPFANNNNRAARRHAHRPRLSRGPGERPSAFTHKQTPPATANTLPLLCVRLGRDRARACIARVLAQHGAQHAVRVARAVVLKQQLRLAHTVAGDLRRARHARSGAPAGGRARQAGGRPQKLLASTQPGAIHHTPPRAGCTRHAVTAP